MKIPVLLSFLLAACTSSSKDSGTPPIDDTGDPLPAPYCDTLSAETRALLRHLSVAGASNSFEVDINNWDSSPKGPFSPGDYDWFYPGKVLQQIWTTVSPCGVEEPDLWVYWYSYVDDQLPDSTLFFAIDGIYHDADDSPDLETFRARVNDYVTTTHDLNPDAPLLLGNIPLIMMYGLTELSEDERRTYNDVVYDEVSAYPNYAVIDLDYWMDLLLTDDALEYNGEDVTFWDIMMDVLHVNELGHDMLSEVVIMALNRAIPDLRLPPRGDLVVYEEVATADDTGD